MTNGELIRAQHRSGDGGYYDKMVQYIEAERSMIEAHIQRVNKEEAVLSQTDFKFEFLSCQEFTRYDSDGDTDTYTLLTMFAPNHPLLEKYRDLIGWLHHHDWDGPIDAVIKDRDNNELFRITDQLQPTRPSLVRQVNGGRPLNFLDEPARQYHRLWRELREANTELNKHFEESPKGRIVQAVRPATRAKHQADVDQLTKQVKEDLFGQVFESFVALSACSCRGYHEATNIKLTIEFFQNLHYR